MINYGAETATTADRNSDGDQRAVSGAGAAPHGARGSTCWAAGAGRARSVAIDQISSERRSRSCRSSSSAARFPLPSLLLAVADSRGSDWRTNRSTVVIESLSCSSLLLLIVSGFSSSRWRRRANDDHAVQRATGSGVDGWLVGWLISRSTGEDDVDLVVGVDDSETQKRPTTTSANYRPDERTITAVETVQRHLYNMQRRSASRRGE